MAPESTSAHAQPESICIVRLSALGDVVMVLPLIKMLRREWPQARITWIIGKEAWPLVAYLQDEGVELIAIAKPRKLKDYLTLRHQLAGRVFDALLCLQASWRANLIYPCIAARRKIGYGHDRAKDMHSLFVRETLPSAEPHIVDGFLQFAEKLGGTRNAVDYQNAWGLVLDATAQAWAAQALPTGPWLAVSLCSSKPERDWPVECYASVIEHAWRAHGMRAVLFGGRAPRELAAASAVLEKIGDRSPIIDFSGKTNLQQLSAAIERCTVLLAPDTGSVHIARALDKPVVGLYAVAPATRTGPYRAAAYCVDKFAEAVALVANGKPKPINWAHRVHDPRAMRLITPDMVCRALDEAIDAVSPRH